MNKIIVTPAGRKRYLEILLSHLLLNKSEFDTWELWMNTTNSEDISYMEEIASIHNFIKLRYLEVPHSGNLSIYSFFKYATDVNSVYLRLDDDIVYIHTGSITTIFTERIKDPFPFLMYGNIVNNALVSHLHQRTRALSSEKPVTYQCMCPVGWNDPNFALEVHNNFFDKLNSNNLESYFMSNWFLHDYARVSINVISWLGKTFSEFNGEVGNDEEAWLSVDKPKSIGRPNLILGNTLFCHYSFFTQRGFLDTTDILEKYRKLASE